MKIKITSDRGPFLDNKPLPDGAVVDVSDEVAAAFLDAGFAEAVKAAAPKRAAPDA